ncbi:MAG: hypothetical protein ACHQJ6_06265 [Candidatus Berkiellales bacterium]
MAWTGAVSKYIPVTKQPDLPKPELNCGLAFEEGIAPTLHCKASHEEFFVFPKISKSKAVGFSEANPAIVASNGYTPLANLLIIGMGSIALLVIFYHVVRHLFSKKKTELEETPSTMAITKPVREKPFLKEMSNLKNTLIKARQRIDNFKKEGDSTLDITYKDLEDLLQRIEKLIEKFNTMGITKEEMRALREDIQHFSKDIKCEFSSVTHLQSGSTIGSGKMLTNAFLQQLSRHKAPLVLEPIEQPLPAKPSGLKIA